MSWVVPPEWQGETAFLLGCGPSLRQSRAGCLSNYGRVIAVNDAYRCCPQADVLYFHDVRWWRKNCENVRDGFYGRYIVTLSDEVPEAKRLRCTGPMGLETDPGALRHGSNSGYQAINLACHFGVKRIVLVGYDLQAVNGQIHWRCRHDEQLDAQVRTMKHVMLPKFESLREPLRQLGVEVVNATPNSALRVWPYRSLGDVLEEVWNENGIAIA